MGEGLIEGIKYERKWGGGVNRGSKVRREMAEGLIEGVKYEGKRGGGVSSADQ
jgi:hypothetical protein